MSSFVLPEDDKWPSFQNSLFLISVCNSDVGQNPPAPPKLLITRSLGGFIPISHLYVTSDHAAQPFLNPSSCLSKLTVVPDCDSNHVFCLDLILLNEITHALTYQVCFPAHSNRINNSVIFSFVFVYSIITSHESMNNQQTLITVPRNNAVFVR